MVLAHFAGKWGPILTPTLKKPCKLGPEPQSTQNDPNLSPNESRKNISRHSDRRFAQNFGPELVGGVPGPNLDVFLTHFWTQI